MGRQRHTSSPKQHRSKRSESTSYIVPSQSTDYPATIYDSGDYQYAGASGSESYDPGNYLYSGPGESQSYFPGNYAHGASNGSQTYGRGDHQDVPGDSQIEAPSQVPIENTPGQGILVRTYQEVRVLVLNWAEEGLPEAELEAQNVQRIFSNLNHVHTTRVTIPINNSAAQVVQELRAFLDGCVEDRTTSRYRKLVVLYYVGHGSPSTAGSLELGRRGSSGDLTSIGWTGIEEVLQQSPHDVIALLNCCYGGTAEPLKTEFPGGTLGKTMDVLTATNKTQSAPVDLAFSFGKLVQAVLKTYLEQGLSQFSAIQLIEDIQSRAKKDYYFVWAAHTPTYQPMLPQHFQTGSRG